MQHKRLISSEPINGEKPIKKQKEHKNSSKVNTYIVNFQLLDKKNKYAQYDKLLFIKLIKCIQVIRELSLEDITQLLMPGSEIAKNSINNLLSYYDRRWLQAPLKQALYKYLMEEANEDILKFYYQIGHAIHFDHEIDFKLLAAYKEKKLSLFEFNNLGKKDPAFEKQISLLEASIKDTSQPNINQEFIRIFNYGKFDEIKESAKKLVLTGDKTIQLSNTKNVLENDVQKSSANEDLSSGQLKQPELNNSVIPEDILPRYILNFKFFDQTICKNKYAQYDKLSFFKMIKCIQRTRRLSLANTFKEIGITVPTNVIDNLLGAYIGRWIKSEFKQKLYDYLTTNEDMLKVYYQMGHAIHFDHEIDFKLLAAYKEKKLSLFEFNNLGKVDPTFEKQIRLLEASIEANIKDTSKPNINQEFIRIINHTKTFDEIKESAKKLDLTGDKTIQASNTKNALENNSKEPTTPTEQHTANPILETSDKEKDHSPSITLNPISLIGYSQNNLFAQKPTVSTPLTTPKPGNPK